MGCASSSSGVAPAKMYAFRIKVLGGLNLYNNEFGVQLPGTKTTKYRFDCKPNSHVEIACEDQKFLTTTKHQNINPCWNEEFIITCSSRKPLLKLRVYDQLIQSNLGKLASGQSSVIGESDINLHGLLQKEEREMWVQLKGSRGKGELGIIVQECYKTEIKVVSGHDLTPQDKFTNTAEVYMTLQVGQQEKQKTTTKSWTINPRWEGESFFFYIPYSPIEAYIQCFLWDKDLLSPDDSMGWAHYNCNTLGVPRDSASGQIKAHNVRLKVGGAAGEIELIVGSETVIKHEASDPGKVSEAQKALWPPSKPQTCTFEVKVLAAFNLAAGDSKNISAAAGTIKEQFLHRTYHQRVGTSDPFARVECDGTIYDTSKQSNTIHPVWNESMTFVCRNKDTSSIKVSVFDHDIVSPNDMLGCMSVPTSTLQSGEYLEVWSPLDKGARGEIGLLLTQMFQVKVRIRKACDLPAADMNGMSDPYLKVGINDVWNQTRIIKNDRNPHFYEDYRWSVSNLGPDMFLDIEAYDSDLVLAKQNLKSELLGKGKVCLHGLKKLVPNEFTVQLTKEDGSPAGCVELYVVDEMPLPPSLLGEIGKAGKEGFNQALEAYQNNFKPIFTVKKEGDPEKCEDPEIEAIDPNFDVRPRYSRMRCTVLACRGLKKKASSSSYVTMEVPQQGVVLKSVVCTTDTKNPDYNHEFCFEVPCRTVGGLRFHIMDNDVVPNSEKWLPQHESRALYSVDVPFKTLNDNQGTIRGSQADDYWIKLGEDEGEFIVRIEEDYRWEFFVRHAKTEGVISETDKTDFIVSLTLGEHKYSTHETTICENENFSLIRESFTVFTRSKNNYVLEVDAGILGKGSFKLEEVKRGVDTVIDVKLDGPQNACVQIFIKEEEKMSLKDQIVDTAKNAAKLAMALANEIGDQVSGAAKAALGSLGGLLGN